MGPRTRRHRRNAPAATVAALLVSLLAGLVVAIVPPPASAAPTTKLAIFESEWGTHVVTPTSVTASTPAGGGITLQFSSPTGTTLLTLQPPSAHAFTVGVYTAAGDVQSTTTPVATLWPICPFITNNGRFAVDQVSLDGSGNVTSLAARFALHCGGSYVASGVVMYNTTTVEAYHDATPAQLNFASSNGGPLYPGDAIPQAFTVTNPSAGPLPIASVVPTTNSFVVLGDQCSGHTLAPGGSCRVVIDVNGATQPCCSISAGLVVDDPMTDIGGVATAQYSISADLSPTPTDTHFRRSNAFFPGGPSNPAEPVIADFTDDGLDDVLWYGTGTATDVLMTASAGRGFTSHPITVGGNYEPLVGDFNGDHHLDIFWYAPGTAADWLWLGTGHGTFRGSAISANGTYEPIVADYDGNGTDDILWYAPGTAADWLWLGRTSGTFAGRAITVNGHYDYVTGGDFNGDGIVDLLWWNANATQFPVWLGAPGAKFRGATFTSPAVGSIPLTMYVDADNLTDIVWYGPGGIRDALVLGAHGYNHLGSLTVNGIYDPVWGNFNGDNNFRDDILWRDSAAQRDVFWAGNGHGFTGQQTADMHQDGPVYLGWFTVSNALDVLYDTPQIAMMSWVYYGIDVDGVVPTGWSMPPRAAETTASPAPTAATTAITSRRALAVRGPGVCTAATQAMLPSVCRSRR